MSAQQLPSSQTTPAAPIDNVIPFPGGALEGCENWPDGCKLIVARDVSGRLRLRPPLHEMELRDFHARMLASALEWAEAGMCGLQESEFEKGLFPVLPCYLIWNAKNRKVKKPPAAGDGGYKNATCNPMLIKQMWKACPGAVVGLRTLHVLAVDTDLAEHSEARQWHAENAHRLADTYGYYTRGGRHSMYLQPPGRPTKKRIGAICPGVDILGYDGYVILWPTLGFEPFSRQSIVSCPGWPTEELRKLDEPCTAPAVERQAEFVSEATLQRRAAIVRQLPNNAEFNARENWIKICAAIQNGFAADPELGRTLWTEFCDRWDGGEIDPDEADKVWDSLECGPLKTGFGSILHYAKKAGIGLKTYRAAEQAERHAALKQATPPIGKSETGTDDGDKPDTDDTDNNSDDAGTWSQSTKSGFADIWMPNTYTLDEKGLYYEKLSAWLMSPFQILGEARDANSSSWGIWLAWLDRDGVPHDWVMPCDAIANDWTNTIAHFLKNGLYVRQGEKCTTLIKNFFGQVRANQRIETVPETGWHQVKTGQDTFICPNGTILGLPDQQTVRYTGPNTASISRIFGARGTLIEWQNAIAAPAVGNDLFILSQCSEFAANLLHVTGDSGTIWHLVGPSQRGKTTLLGAAGSIYGLGAVSNGVVLTWHTTDNGLESVNAG